MQLHIQSPVLTWNESKRLSNIRAHRVDFSDLEPFFDGRLLTYEDELEFHGEQRFLSLGMLGGGCLFVVWTLRNEGDTAHIISARRATKHETQEWYQYISKYS